MHSNTSINTFTINLPVNDHVIRVMLCLFCGNPSRNNKKRFSYSIVSKISGVTCRNASVDIVSDYGRGGKLKDQLLILQNQFIYSNQSTVSAILDIAMQLKGILPWEGTVDVCFNMKLRYTLQRLIVNDIKSEYVMKNVPGAKVLLLQ